MPGGIAHAADGAGAAAEAIVFVRQGDIWVSKSDGTGQRRLTSLGACGGPALSPDGQWILWQQSGSDVSGGFAVTDLKEKTFFRYPPQGKEPTVWWGARLAPDGQTVLCYSPATSETSVDTIYMVDSKLGKSVEVTTGASPAFVHNGAAVFSNGGRIAGATGPPRISGFWN